MSNWAPTNNVSISMVMTEWGPEGDIRGPLGAPPRHTTLPYHLYSVVGIKAHIRVTANPNLHGSNFSQPLPIFIPLLRIRSQIA